MLIRIHLPINARTCSIYRAKIHSKFLNEQLQNYFLTTFPSAWVEKKCLFPIEEEPLTDFTVPGAEDGALYEKLHDLMSKNKDLDFWIAMAKKERMRKGPQNKEPFLVMPSTSDNSDEMAIDSDDASEHSRGLKPYKQRVTSKSNAFSKSTLLHLPPPDPEEIVDVYVGHGEDHKVFQLTRRAINKSSVLRQIVQQGTPPYVMHPTLFRMGTRTFELVCAFICSDSEDIGLEQVGEEEEEDEEDEILGDVLPLRRTHILRDFNDQQSLNNSISDLGKTYLIASSLGLGSMQTAIIRRLQVTWNMSCGVDQTLAILDTIDTVADAIYAADTNLEKGHVTKEEPFLNWSASFLSELFMVFITKHTERFTGFMQKYLALQAAVLTYRAQACNFDPQRLSRLEIQFMMGPERVVAEVENKQDDGMTT
jgi:hypothetical protein